MTGDATVHRRWRVRLRRRSACRKRRCLPRRKDSGLGMGGMEATCGAVSGAVMLAGFKNSCADPKNPKTKAATYPGDKRDHQTVCREEPCARL